MEKYILSIDSGGRSIKAFLVNKRGQIIFRESINTPSLHLGDGIQEHEPIFLFDSMLAVIRNLLIKANCTVDNIESLGMSIQRGSIMFWERESGKPVSQLINWADTRCAETAYKMNRKPLWVIIRTFSKIVKHIVPLKILQVASMLDYTTDHGSAKVSWYFKEHPELKKRCYKGEICFGQLDSWLLYNLNKDRRHITDTSCAMATSLLNPFSLKWNTMVFKTFGIPKQMMPEYIDSNGDFGFVDEKFFGKKIPITGVLGDQSAALYGHKCFEKGDIKVTQGTGSFINLNVGYVPKLSKHGLFPLVAWQIDGKTNYMLEGQVATVGTFIDWIYDKHNSGQDLDELARKCKDSAGVTVVPIAAGIRYPYFKPNSRASVLGLSLTTTRSNVARAVFEGISHRLSEIIHGMNKDSHTELHVIKADGGVSNSDILLQALANFSGLEVLREKESNISGLGAAYIAGIGCGFWKNGEEIKNLKSEYDDFVPLLNEEQRKVENKKWIKSVKATLRS